MARASTDFGSRQVPLEEKQRLVDDVFRKVAPRYDLMNDLMSAGLHRAWKEALVARLRPPPGRPLELLDVAGGTGDIALRALAAYGSRVQATIADPSREMLAVGQERAVAATAGAVEFVAASAESLPFADQRFDAVTIGFGLRNVPRREAALAEMLRVLKRGGRFLCLEFSRIDVPGLEALYDLYSRHLIPELGRQVVGDAEPYRYLVESIQRFPDRESLSGAMRAAGFARVRADAFAGGIVALHSAWRL